MDNSSYLPNTSHINAPALVVFSQASGGLQDALRIQRPFNPQFQMSEANKELHRPFSAANLGLRHMEAYSAIPAHILNHLQPQFLHPGFTIGTGAFRPLGDLKAFPSPSAFAPPKCLKIETSSDNSNVHGSHQQGQLFSPAEERFLGPSPRTDSCSPLSASMSPQPQPSNSVKEESMDAQASEDGDGGIHGLSIGNDSSSPGTHDDTRGFRSGPLFGGNFSNAAYSFMQQGLPPAAHAHTVAKSSFLFDQVHKKKRDPSSCPVCGLTISPGDLEPHFIHELDRLYKLNGSGILAGRKRAHETSRPPALPGDSGPEGRWETFQRIKTNRQGRLRIKLRKRKSDDCLLCFDRGHRTPEEMNLHAQQCRKNSEDETVDVEGDSEFEEWTEGQRRRTHSLITHRPVRSRYCQMALPEVKRSFRNYLFSASTPSSTGAIVEDLDENDDVIVDGDDPDDSVFGPTQYTESDVVVKLYDEAKETEGVQSSQVATVNSSGDCVEVKTENQSGDNNVSTSDAESTNRAHIIEELKNRIKQLEAENNGDAAAASSSGVGHDNEDYKCLICLEHYKKPVISTVCWHVHCEECWLHTLGSKKVCPQCSMITSPTDLRRIFM